MSDSTPHEITTPVIQSRINALKAERDRLIEQANRQVSAYNGAIVELEKLIAPVPDDAPKDEGV